MLHRYVAAVCAATSLSVPFQAAPAQARAAGETRFGVITSTQGPKIDDTYEEHIRLYDEHRRRYGAPIGVRVFAGRGGVLPLPTDHDRSGRLLAWAAREHPDEHITVSHKLRDDGRLRKLLKWVRDNGVRLSVIYRHEAQPDWFDKTRTPEVGARPDVYRETYRAYRAIIAAQPAEVRAKVTLEKNLMWFWQRYNPVPGSDWHNYVERDDPADLLSWDTYAFPGMPTKQGHYGTPDDFFRYARDAWREFHLQWGVGEIGSIVQDRTSPDDKCTEQSWDPDGSRFAAWVKRMADAASAPGTINPQYAGMPPAKFVKWWGALDADNCDLSLEQVPAAVAAYRSRVRANPL